MYCEEQNEYEIHFKLQGPPIMLPDYYPASLRRGYRSEGPGPMYKPLDQFDKTALDVKIMATKRVGSEIPKMI